MRYLVKARLKKGRGEPLLRAIEEERLGEGSIAGEEYLENMREARVDGNEVAHWVETCFCDTPLAEERPYWEEYFELLSVRDANGSEPWACCDCDCTRRLEERLATRGKPFLEALRSVRSGQAEEPK